MASLIALVANYRVYVQPPWAKHTHSFSV